MSKSIVMLRLATVVSLYLTSGQKTVLSSSSQPSSAPVYGPITTESIENEGRACFDLARAIPGLKALTGLTGGKTRWATTNTTWFDHRSLFNNPEADIMKHVEEEAMAVHRGLYTTQPSWCSFMGVTCGTVSGTPSYAAVISINLFYMRLAGSLPSSIGNLQSLKSFDVRYNGLKGTIPSSIGLLKETMTFLGLEANSFTGTLPRSVFLLKALTGLHAGSNLLRGTIPAAIGDLKSLTTLYLGTNSFTGTIPSSIGDLTALKGLYLNANLLGGTIPPNIGSLSSIKYIYLDSNTLTGSIPGTISTLLKLEDLTLSSNYLSGTIPSTISKLTRLSNLDLNTNYLTMGTLSTVPPSTFSSATLDGYLAVSNNCLAYKSTHDPTQSTTATHCRPSNEPTSRAPTQQPTRKPTGPTSQPTSNPTSPSSEPTSMATSLPTQLIVETSPPAESLVISLSRTSEPDTRFSSTNIVIVVVVVAITSILALIGTFYALKRREEKPLPTANWGPAIDI